MRGVRWWWKSGYGTNTSPSQFVTSETDTHSSCGCDTGNVSVLMAEEGLKLDRERSSPHNQVTVLLRSCVRAHTGDRSIHCKTLVIVYLSVNAPGDGTKRRELRMPQRTKERAHITNEIYDGYDTRWVDLHTQDTKKALRKCKQKRDSCWDGR